MKADGEAKTVVAMYESSIEEQEEQALRQKVAVAPVEHSSRDAKRLLHAIVRSRTGFALQKMLAIDTIALEGAPGSAFTLIAADRPQTGHRCRTATWVPSRSSMDAAAVRWARTARFTTRWNGSPPCPKYFDLGRARVRWHYCGSDAAELVVFSGASHVLLRGDLTAGDGWQERSFDRIDGPPEPLRTVAQSQFGTGKQRILGVRMLAANGEDVTRVRHGDPLTLRLHVAVYEAGLRQTTFVSGFTRLNTPYAVNIINHRLDMPQDVNEYALDVRPPSVQLGSGTWYLRVGLGEAACSSVPRSSTSPWIPVGITTCARASSSKSSRRVISTPPDASWCIRLRLPSHQSRSPR